jgi:hypothetical protein
MVHRRRDRGDAGSEAPLGPSFALEIEELPQA